MSDWYWRVVALKAAFFLTCFASFIRADDSVQKLPFCNPQSAVNAPGLSDLVLVSTLDGKLTAFSTNDGNKAWDVQTQPLLSSNLHHVELTSGGKWVRLVPSLRGTLYSLSGDTVEPLPFTAEQLLSSSFKYSNDLVIAGSKETLWMGIDTATGAIVYECGGSGCGNSDRGALSRPLLAVRRHASTVRALDPSTGDEKWNFSVAEHNLALSGQLDCAPPKEVPPLRYTVRVAPEGGVAVCTADSRAMLWQQQLEAPVANMWRLRAGSLESIDVLWAATKSLSSETYVQTTPPSLYIGLHNQQLYIQEGEKYVQKMETSVSAKPLPWKLKNTRPLINGPETTTALQNADPNTLSLITLYGNTGQGNHGFFLYQEETCDQAVQVSDQDLHGPEIIDPQGDQGSDRMDHHHVHVHVYSLWFWWKEVLLIAISSTLLMNLMIWPRFFAPKFRPPTPLPVNKEYIVVEKHYERPVINQEYSGRYENDFTPLRCLGRGGFGVVFEARNNIDHCSYAVKRITLPRRESKRERVLREVRALAKLEHEHIVRYFNAWLEEPPARWQEARDLQWMRELDGVSVPMTEEFTSVSPPPPPAIAAPAPLGDTHSDGVLDIPSKRHRSRSCNDSFSIVFDEDAKGPSSSLKNSLDLTLNRVPQNLSLAKNLANSDHDDSFIVFANSEDLNHNSKGNHNSQGVMEMHQVNNRQLERVQECEEVSKAQAATGKKKKGHTRHWSLDMCVKTSGDSRPPNSSKMYLYIQMQLCLRDSLHDWLRQNRTYESRRDKVKTLFSQIVSAVEYVHLAGLIHRDLKPSNIFFAPDGKVKVGDFGLVTAMSDISQDGESPPAGLDAHTRHTYRVGTHLYMSPEQLRGRPYSYKVDIYSLGLVLFELLQPFGTEAERIQSLLGLRRGEYPGAFKENYPEEMEVLKMMLSEEPALRPTAAGVRARAPLRQDTDQRYHFTLPGLVGA